MNWIATFFTLLALAATGLAGKELHGALSEPTPQAPPAQVARAVADVVEVASVATTPRWPALFGEPLPPKPPEPEPPTPVAQEEPQPPEPPRPPVSSLGYELKGIVRAGDAVWGLVSHPTGEQIMRAGDMLADDLPIARIDETGLWVDNGGEEPELLGYPEN